MVYKVTDRAKQRKALASQKTKDTRLVAGLTMGVIGEILPKNIFLA